MVLQESCHIPVGKVILEGDLIIPERAKGIVLFAHGSGSSRKSPRNRFVASLLNKAGLATLLFDLLTREEEIEDSMTAQLRFNIPMLAKRLKEVSSWIKKNARTQNFAMGYFGSSTGAAAALIAAANNPDVKAVVSRGGRVDLAKEVFSLVHAATLLIVGGYDTDVLELNRESLEGLHCDKRLDTITGASHLFEEPGALEIVADLAAKWFCKHFS